MRLGFLLLIGLPGSGKTTFAKYLARNVDRCSGSSHHFLHVCYDDLIHFPKENNEFDWKSARNSVSVKIEKLVVAVKNKSIDSCPEEFITECNSVKNCECDVVLILDDNMYFKSMRYSLFQIAKKHSIGFCQIFLNCPLEQALMTNSLRTLDSKVPTHVIENMHSKIEPPSCKNDWEKYSIELESFCDLNVIYSKLLPILSESLNNVSYENDNTELTELSKIQCQLNVVHQTDLALRKIIKCKVINYLRSQEEKPKDYIAGLTVRKSEILSDVKSGNICLPDQILAEINSDALEKLQLINFLEYYLSQC